MNEAPFGNGEILSKTCFGLQNPYTGELAHSA